MTAIVWGSPENRRYEYGIDHVVLYPPFGADGVPWNGVVSIEETVVGGEATPLYYDGVKYLDVIAYEDYQANLTAVNSPDEFDRCEGIVGIAAGLFATQQPRLTFGLSYRSRIGSAANSQLGYKLHLVYNATASPSGISHNTLADKVDPEDRSWTIDCVPPAAPGMGIKPTAHFVIDSTKVPYDLDLLEAALYGDDDITPYLPAPIALAGLLDPGE